MVVPGIYVQEQQYNLNALSIDNRCLTAFAGIAEYGPLNQPVLIKSFDEYLKVFGGFDTAGVLPCSVFSYFRCGGKECVIVRVADKDTIKNAVYKIKTQRGHIKFTAKTPGKWGNYIVISIWQEKDNYISITLNYKAKKESFIHLSLDSKNERFIENIINENSLLCDVKCGGQLDSLQPLFMKTFYGGTDGIAELNASDFIGHYDGLTSYEGIGCFESRDDISLIAVPDLMWLKDKNDIYAVQNAMVTQAERFPGRFAILDIPEKLDVVEASDWAKKINTAYGAIYYPFIDVTDPLDKTGIETIRIPPSGGVCGCIAASDGEKGVYHAPANCLIEGAVGISQSITSGENEMLCSNRINCLKYFPGRGVKVWGAKTLSCDKEWEFINVRRTFSRVCSSLKEGTQWAVFEPNDKKLRKRLVRQVSGFLLDLWREGYFAGATPEQGFYVKCDEELNPPENIDAGILTFEVGIAIVRPVEFFKIMLTAQKEGASVYLNEI